MESNEPNRAGGALGGLFEGAFLLVEGGRFLRGQRRLWFLALIPMLFTLISVTAVTALFWARLDGVHAAWSGLLPVLEAGAWWSWIWVGPGRILFWLLGWLAVIVSFAVSLMGGLLVANLISAPFLDLLSQRVEEIESGVLAGDGVGGFGNAFRAALKSFAAEFARLAFLASAWLVLSAVGFVVPGAHLVSGPLLIGLTILFLPLDYAGFALDRRGLSFGKRRQWLAEHLFLMLGFGGVAFVACLVPGLNLLVLPAQVTAGTLLVVRRKPQG